MRHSRTQRSSGPAQSATSRMVAPSPELTRTPRGKVPRNVVATLLAPEARQRVTSGKRLCAPPLDQVIHTTHALKGLCKYLQTWPSSDSVAQSFNVSQFRLLRSSLRPFRASRVY